MKITETLIHIEVRRFLKNSGWTLVAGQYPGGSDDELHPLNIVDPALACDHSPDHRRHSMGKYVPDLIAYKDKELLIIEAKPRYSIGDEQKLIEILTDRLSEFYIALRKFGLEKTKPFLFPVEELKLSPALAFSAKSKFKHTEGFQYFLVNNLGSVEYIK